MYLSLFLLVAAALSAEATSWGGPSAGDSVPLHDTNSAKNHIPRGSLDGDSSQKSNIIFVILDDLDSYMSKLEETMPSLKKHVIDEGTTFARHYCTVSLCCPARASILTGQTAHNHNVTDVAYPSGGYPKFHEQGYNDDYLPIWLQEAGYNTYYTGKLLNEITVSNWNTLPVNGWTGIDTLLDPFAYNYDNPCFGRNGKLPVYHNDEYVSDLISDKAMAYLDEALTGNEPFFLGIAPNAPHSEVLVDIKTQTGYETVPRAAKRHAGRFSDELVPRGPNFNPEKASGASWIKELDRLNETQISYGDEWQRGRLEALLSVDEIIERLFEKLEKADVLDNTFVIFTSDNGFHISQHRLTPGKTCGFEEDINVPFYIRGPGIAKGEVLDIVSAHIDVAPTILSMAGISQRESFDGRPMPLTRKAAEEDTQPRTEQATVEMWRSDNDNSGLNSTMHANNTYKSVRLHSDEFNFYYSVWCTNEHQLYDLNTDPYQMNNLFDHDTETEEISPSISVKRIASRLDALLYVLKSCRGDSCRYPWKALMPKKGVNNLSDALDPKYDDFFSKVPEVSYSSCQGSYILSEEGPQFETWPEKSGSNQSGASIIPRSLMREYLLMA